MNCKYIICPKCGTHFDYEENLKFKINSITSFFNSIITINSFKKTGGSKNNDRLKNNIVVECPNCSENFFFEEYKFFRIFSFYQLNLIIVLLPIAFIIISIYIIIDALMK